MEISKEMLKNHYNNVVLKSLQCSAWNHDQNNGKSLSKWNNYCHKNQNSFKEMAFVPFPNPNPKSTFANIPFWVQGSRVRNIFVLKIWDSLRSEVNCSLEFQFAVIYEGCLPFTTAGNNYDVTTCNFGIKVTVEEVLIRCRRTFLSRHIDSWNNDDKRTRTTPCLPHTTALICWGDVKRLTRKLSWKRSAAANEQS